MTDDQFREIKKLLEEIRDRQPFYPWTPQPLPPAPPVNPWTLIPYYPYYQGPICGGAGNILCTQEQISAKNHQISTLAHSIASKLQGQLPKDLQGPGDGHF